MPKTLSRSESIDRPETHGAGKAVLPGPTAEGSGAGDETRTRDIQLGRLKLYQLSYSRLIDTKRISRYIDTSEVMMEIPLVML